MHPEVIGNLTTRLTAYVSADDLIHFGVAEFGVPSLHTPLPEMSQHRGAMHTQLRSQRRSRLTSPKPRYQLIHNR